MQRHQSFLLSFTAAVLIAALPTFGNIQDVLQEENRGLDQEDNNIFQFEKFSSQSVQLKAKVNEEVATVFISISDMAIDRKEQHIESLIKNIDKKCTTIVLSVEQFDLDNLQVLPDAVEFRFVEAVLEENEIRKVEGLPTLQIYFHIPTKAIRDMKSVNDLSVIGVGFGAYIFGEGVVSGFVFESSLIQNPVEFKDNGYSGVIATSDLWTGMGYMKKFMMAIELTFGYELKLGLSFNSFKECGSTFLSLPDETLSLFDFVLYNGLFQTFESGDSGFVEGEASDLYSESCGTLFKGKPYYRVKQIL